MRLVVIGGVAAGLSAASRARRIDPSLEIVVMEKTTHISYGACGLPYFIEGQVRSLDQLNVYDVAFFARERNIQIRLNSEVRSIAHHRREVVLSNGERAPYDKLVIATGARRVAARRGEMMFPIDTWAHAERLQNFIQQSKPKTAAILGGGYIGIEMAEALRAQGLKVTLFQRSGHLLNRRDAWLTSMVSKHLQRCRVEVRLNQTLENSAGFHLLIAAYGLKPNVQLAHEAGIELGRTGAIRANERMETNLNGVYAAGDCAETAHRVTGRPAWFPLGTTANKMGRVAGACAAGARERMPGIVGTSIVRVCGLGVGMTGLSAVDATKEGFDPVSVEIEALDRARYFRGKPTHVQLVADQRSGRLLGGAVIGDDGVAGRINVIATALTAGMLAEDFVNLDLAYSPPFSRSWDPLLIAAQQLVKLLH
jgi:NADPH-dependent 2,4-dienoyl-CoA reductase/sulfur reductase-like enzyme